MSKSTFRTSVNGTPFTVTVGESGVTAHRAADGFTARSWSFDNDLTPVGFARAKDHGSDLYTASATYSLNNPAEAAEAAAKAAAAAGTEQNPLRNKGIYDRIRVIDDHGSEMASHSPISGVADINQALEAIRKAAATPTFPKHLAAKIPAAFQKLGLSEPSPARNA